MANEEQDITVKVDETESEQVADAVSADPVAELKAQYDEIQEQQKRDQEARAQAEARARASEAARQQAEQVAHAARSEASDSRLTSIDRDIEAAKAQAEAASSEYTSALEAGDWKRAGEAQRKLSRAEAQAVQYEQNKALWERAKEQQSQPQRQQPVGDSVDAYINQIAQQTPNSANWLRQHRDWITDPGKNDKLTKAHYHAVGEGIAVDSPEYFIHVERRIGLTQQEPEKKPNGAAASPAAPARRQAAPVAPVSPSPGGTSGGGAEVRLTKGEAAAATDGTLVWNYDDPSGQRRFKKGDSIGLQEMAKRKKVMQEQGLYDKTQYEA